MADLPEARVGHFSAGRLRVKIPEKRHDAAFFHAVAERLAGWDSVDRIEVNPLTASVLLHFADPHALFFENAAKNDLFDLAIDESGTPPPPARLNEQAARGFANADATVRRWTGDTADLRSAVFLMLLVGGMTQLFRGAIAAPAATLLWYAGDMIGLWRFNSERGPDDAEKPAKTPARG
jgi:hypothetical protein